MLPYLAILMTGLLLCCGVAVDVGLMQTHKLQMQFAADAAAMGGELEQERGTYDSAQNRNGYVTAGLNDAALNGFTDGTNNTAVTVTARFRTGILTGHHDGVQVLISQPQTGIFTRLLNGSPVSASAIALAPPCIMTTGSKSLTTYQLSVTSNTGYSGNGACPAYVNGAVSVDNSSYFYPVETIVTGPQANSAWNPAGSYWPPRYTEAVLPDPLRNIPQPTAGGCATTNYSQVNVSTNQYAPPVTYCGDSSYSCANSNVVISFSPGLYVFAGSLSISNCTVSGTGATFFFTKNASTGSYGKLAFSQVIMNMTAPTTSSNGSIAGVLFMTDRNWVPNTAQDFVLDTCTFQGDGIWYLTNAGMWIKSSSLNTTNYQAILAENLQISNASVTLISNYAAVSGGNPLRRNGTLAE